MIKRNSDPQFWEYNLRLMQMGFHPYFDKDNHSRFELGRYRCRGRSYYLKLGPRSPRDVWNSTVVFFYDPDPTMYPCVKTMIKAANHFAMIKAEQFVEFDKVFDLCS